QTSPYPTEPTNGDKNPARPRCSPAAHQVPVQYPNEAGDSPLVLFGKALPPLRPYARWQFFSRGPVAPRFRAKTYTTVGKWRSPRPSLQEGVDLKYQKA